MKKERWLLAAIMFTDIVGYTALMQESEQYAARIRERHRSVFQKAHQHHHGEVIQYYGDGTLSIFQSAVEAVHCAIRMQEQFNSVEVVPLRIGIHLGDIVCSEQEVYGGGDLVRNGKSLSGAQRYRCKECSKTFQVDYSYKACEPGVRDQIIDMAHNGARVRDTSRVLGVSQSTVISTIKKNRDASST